MPVTFKVTDTNAEKIQSTPFKIKNVLPPNYENHRPVENKSHSFVRSNIDETDTKNISLQGNSFVWAAFRAYSNHHNLVISPDDVWLAIMTQFSFYLNKHAETLRSKFVDFQGKKELTVYGSGTLFSADYHYLCNEMTKQIAKNIKDPTVREWVMPDFSTTTENEKLVGAIVLMAALKKYFEYKMVLDCNLPSVTLLGEVEDWEKVRDRANRLVEYDVTEGYMQKWSDMLLPILDQFIDAARGNPDVNFWNKIANQVGGGSGPSWLSGWITAFCIFSKDGDWNGDEKTINDWGATKTAEWLYIDTDEIPTGYVTCPVKIEDDLSHDCDLIAGHTHGVMKDDVTLAPAVGWTLWEVDRTKDAQVKRGTDSSSGCIMT